MSTIGGLPQAAAVASTDVLPIQQGDGATRQASVSAILAAVSAAITAAVVAANSSASQAATSASGASASQSSASAALAAANNLIGALNTGSTAGLFVKTSSTPGTGALVAGNVANGPLVLDGSGQLSGAVIGAVGPATANPAALRASALLNVSDGDYVFLTYHTNKGDGGHGWFQYVASDTTSADTDGLCIVDSLGRRFHRLFTGDIMAAWFGIGSTAGVDYSSALLAAYNACVSYGKGNRFSFKGVANVITLTQPFMWDLFSVPIDLGNSTLSWATASSSVVAMNLINTQGAQQPPITANMIGPGKLVGPGYSTSSVGLYFNSTSTDQSAFLNTDNITISGFGTGHLYNNQAIFTKHTNGVITQCGTPINVMAGTNAGEAISYSKYVINNSSGIVTNSGPNTDLYFDLSSIDYCTLGWLSSQGGAIYFSNGHLEGNSSTDVFTQPPLQVSSAQSSLISIKQSKIICAQTLASSNIAYVANVQAVSGPSNPSCGGLELDSVYCANLLTTTGIFSEGGGRFITRDVSAIWGGGGSYMPFLKSVADNLLQDGGFEASGQVYDPFIVSDSATITSRLTGSAITLAQSSAYKAAGTYSLAVNLLSASGNPTWGFLVPIEKFKLYGAQIYYANPNNLTGTIYATLSFIKAYFIPQFGPPSFGLEQNAFTASITLSSTGSTFEAVNLGGAFLLPPEWATHVYVTINEASRSGGLMFWDSAVITGY